MQEKAVPMRIDREALDTILVEASENDASDIHLKTNTPIISTVHGKLKTLMPRRLSATELQLLVEEMLGGHSSSSLANGMALNPSYPVRYGRGNHLMFRVNVVPCWVDGMDGIHMVLRYIPTDPPSLVDLEVEQEIIDASRLMQGLVLVTGAVGTGKSTILAALIRAICDDPEAHQVILTYESPIEFIHPGPYPSTIIVQSEVPRHFKTFHKGIEESLRRAPTLLMVGEVRDPESISAACVAAQAGRLVLTTTHTNSVSETVQRLINVFSADERRFQQANLIDTLRLVVTQTLVPSAEGKRVALREYLTFNESMRMELLSAEPQELSGVVRKLVNQSGRSMVVDAERKYKEGRITKYVFERVFKSFGG